MKTQIKVVCLECGRKFKTASICPSCPKCGGYPLCVAITLPDLCDEKITLFITKEQHKALAGFAKSSKPAAPVAAHVRQAIDEYLSRKK